MNRRDIPAWPRKVDTQRQLSEVFVIPELPNTALGPLPFFQIIISLSSPPEASMSPFRDHRTLLTHCKWLSSWHKIFGQFLSISASSTSTGFIFQITTRPDSFPWPPVANLFPSGCTSTENIGLPAWKDKYHLLQNGSRRIGIINQNDMKWTWVPKHSQKQCPGEVMGDARLALVSVTSRFLSIYTMRRISFLFILRQYLTIICGPFWFQQLHLCKCRIPDP